LRIIRRPGNADAWVSSALPDPAAGGNAPASAGDAGRHGGGRPGGAGGRRLQQNEREAASILSTAQRHTHFLDFPQVAASLAGSDFAFAEIMRRNGTVFLALPPDRLRTCSRWLRLPVGQAIRETVRNPPQGRRALLLLDECASLGCLRPLEDALGVAAGYGLQIWCVFQDMHRLRARYGRAADSFLANAGMLQFFNVSDLETRAGSPEAWAGALSRAGEDPGARLGRC